CIAWDGLDGGIECRETDFVGSDVGFVLKQRAGVDDAAANLEHPPFALLLRVRQNVAFRIIAAEQHRHTTFDTRFAPGLPRLLRATVETRSVEQPAVRADLESVFEEGALAGSSLNGRLVSGSKSTVSMNSIGCARQ